MRRKKGQEEVEVRVAITSMSATEEAMYKWHHGMFWQWSDEWAAAEAGWSSIALARTRLDWLEFMFRGAHC